MRTFNQKYFFMNSLRTYIAESRIFQEKQANEIRCFQNNYFGFYTSENIYIFRCIFSELTLLLSDFRKLCMFHKKLFHWAIKNRPVEPKIP